MSRNIHKRDSAVKFPEQTATGGMSGRTGLTPNGDNTSLTPSGDSSSAATVELWERAERVGEDTGFRWMVWWPGVEIDGQRRWFDADQEDEARELFARLAGGDDAAT
jgi:hypothetical protein